MKKNACIFLISARPHFLPSCLQQLDLNYNSQFNYPILIFYHGTKYDDLEFRKSIQNINPSTEIQFHQIEAKIPDNIEEKDLFYNLDCAYAQNDFPKSRMGYLHANYFWNNFMDYPQLKGYDYMMRIDDDSWFRSKLNFDFFGELDAQDKLCGTAYSWNHVSDRVLDTRMNFYSWIQSYCSKYGVTAKSKSLAKYLEEGENDMVEGRRCNSGFHSMKHLSGNCSIFNRQMFLSSSWANYLKEFNDISGGYRYRWGDCEVQSMYYYLHLGEEYMDLDLIDKGLYSNHLPSTNMIHGEWSR
jgi:hypothetical protein